MGLSIILASDNLSIERVMTKEARKGQQQRKESMLQGCSIWALCSNRVLSAEAWTQGESTCTPQLRG